MPLTQLPKPPAAGLFANTNLSLGRVTKAEPIIRKPRALPFDQHLPNNLIYYNRDVVDLIMENHQVSLNSAATSQ